MVEFHGNGNTLVCLSCGRRYEAEEVRLAQIPPLCKCSMVLKPDVVFIGEMIPWGASLRAEEAAQNCSVMLVVGTSVQMWPASEIPRTANSNSAKIVEINTEKTELTADITDHYIGESASLVLPAIVAELKRMKQES